MNTLKQQHTSTATLILTTKYILQPKCTVTFQTHCTKYFHQFLPSIFKAPAHIDSIYSTVCTEVGKVVVVVVDKYQWKCAKREDFKKINLCKE
jgi:hypothetical protein